MNSFNLPDEVIEYLRTDRQFDYDHRRIEAGEVQLKALNDPTEGEVWIGTDIPGDPHAGSAVTMPFQQCRSPASAKTMTQNLYFYGFRKSGCLALGIATIGC